jgi:hypothetical protein
LERRVDGGGAAGPDQHPGDADVAVLWWGVVGAFGERQECGCFAPSWAAAAWYRAVLDLVVGDRDEHRCGASRLV